MKRKIKISSSFSGVIPTGSFQNSRPAFSAEEEFEFDGDDKEANLIHEVRMEELYMICREKFNSVAEIEKTEKIKNDRKDFRFYKLEDGTEVPSVTSILNFDTDFLVDEGDLMQYAAQGTINHKRVEEYIKTGEWKTPKDIEGIVVELFLLKQGRLQLDPDACDFPAFLKKYPITNLENGEIVLNEEHKYGGLPDGIGVFNGLKTLFDIKRTPNKVKDFQQMSAYAKCMKDIEQLMIIPLNDSTDQKFSKPFVTLEIDKYFELFLHKRLQFRKVYGI